MTPFLEEVHRSSEAILAGQTILYPTDTIWGVGADATSAVAVQKIYRIKRRPEQKSCIILVPDLRALQHFLAAPPLYLEEIMEQYQDRATTFVLDQAINLPENLINEDGSIAVRIPKDDFCQALLRKTGVPIVSTSANISGMPNPTNFAAIDPEIKNNVDYIVALRQTEQAKATPSRIARIQGDHEVTLLRE